jgi:hypothetical protein
MATASGDPGSGGTRRRLFSSRKETSGLDPALEAEVQSINAAILDRLERGLSEIEENARTLMHAAAEDTWHGTEAELKELREKIMRDLSRDQALRGLIAHADERYQSLDVRVGRMEHNLTNVERAATTLTAVLGEATRIDDDGRPGILAMEGRIAGLEGSIDGIRHTSLQLQDRLDAGIAEVTALIADTAGRPVQAADGSAAATVDIRPIAERLSAVQDYIGEVVEYLSARDQALVEWIQGVAQHSDGVVAAESARVEEALTGRFDLATLESEGKLREIVAQRVEEIHERLQEHARILGEAVSVVEARAISHLNEQDERLAGQSRQLEAMASRLEIVRQAAIDAAERVSAGLHERLAELADQMRAESEDMRTGLVERAAQAGLDATRGIDERLGRLAELVQAALGWSVDEIDQRIHREILRAVSVGMADFVAAMDRRFVELHDAIDERITDVSRGVDGRFDLIGRSFEERLERTDRAMRAGLGALEESIVERAALTLDSTIERRLTPAAEQIARTVESSRIMLEDAVVRNVSQRADALARLVEERAGAITGMIAERAEITTRTVESRADGITRLIEERMTSAAQSIEEAITRTLSDRVAALAAMIRSDNTAIADRLATIEEQAAAKEAVRAIKELGAAMPQEISEAMDERLAVLGELFRRENKHTVDTVARAATAIADRLDKTAIVIGERFDRDVEVVVDQIGSTMQTLASGLQRASGRGAANRPVAG